LSQYAGKQGNTDIAAMWVRNPNGHIVTNHVLVLATGERSVKSQGTQKPHKIRPRNWANAWH